MTTRKTVPTKSKDTTKKIPVKKPSVKKSADSKSAQKRISSPDLKKSAKPSKKSGKKKVVRDSFTMPQSEYLKIGEIKAICLRSSMHVKKSEVLRAGLKVLSKLNATQLKRELNNLEKIKTGRPKKH